MVTQVLKVYGLCIWTQPTKANNMCMSSTLILFGPTARETKLYHKEHCDYPASSGQDGCCEKILNLVL